MARAVLFMWDPKTDKTSTQVFSTPNFPDPVRAAENIRESCKDDFPGAIWSIGSDEEARNLVTNTRMHEMGFEGYDHASRHQVS